MINGKHKNNQWFIAAMRFHGADVVKAPSLEGKSCCLSCLLSCFLSLCREEMAFIFCGLDGFYVFRLQWTSTEKHGSHHWCEMRTQTIKAVRYTNGIHQWKIGSVYPLPEIWCQDVFYPHYLFSGLLLEQFVKEKTDGSLITIYLLPLYWPTPL